MATSSSAPAPWPIVIRRSPRNVWTNTCCMLRMDPPVIILVPATGSLRVITNYRRIWPALNASSSGDTLPGIIGATVATAQVCRFSLIFDHEMHMQRHYEWRYILWITEACKVAVIKLRHKLQKKINILSAKFIMGQMATENENRSEFTYERRSGISILPHFIANNLKIFVNSTLYSWFVF